MFKLRYIVCLFFMIGKLKKKLIKCGYYKYIN